MSLQKIIFIYQSCSACVTRHVKNDSQELQKVLSLVVQSNQGGNFSLWVDFWYVNSLPNDKILDWSKLEGFADDKINVTGKLKFVL